MKKITKILLLVLSLSLICGIIAVAAFADTGTTITGVRLDASGDFESTKSTDIVDATTGSQVTNLDQDNGAKKMLMFKHQIGGDAKLVVNPVDNNTYVTVEWGTATSGSGHFLENYTAINGWGTLKDDATEYYDEFKYYVVDFDVAWFDAANYDGSGFFYPYSCYTNAAGSGRVDITGHLGLNFTKSNGQVVASIRGGDGTKTAVGNDKWSHVTWIMEPIVITDDNGENLKIKQYFAIDGVVVSTSEWISTIAASSMYNGDRTRFYTLDVRLDVFGRKLTSGCVDNYNYRTFLPEYNGNLATVLADGVGADLTKFESNLYNADKMPAGQAKASVGNVYYDSFDKALAAASNGSTIVLQNNITTPVVVNKPVTIECGAYTFSDIKGGKDVIASYDATAKTWTFKSFDNYAITYTTASGVVGIETGVADAFKTALTNVADGGVVTLYDDAVYTPAADLSVNKNVTLDLNGHVLDMLTTYKGKYFYVSGGKTFTVLGEEEGSALICGYSNGKNSAAGTLFTSGDNATINLKGKGLFVSCAALFGAWANIHVTINIEDCYINHNKAGDNIFNIYVSSGSGDKVSYTLNIKNAVVNGLTAGINGGATAAESIVNIENSVILSEMFPNNSTVPVSNQKTTVNVKGNCYITGSFATVAAVNVTGENNYFTSNDWVSKATFEEGINLVSKTTSKVHDNYTHPWVVSGADAEWDKAATLAISKTQESQSYYYNTDTAPIEYLFEYTSGGKTYSYASLDQAIAAAPAGATIKMLKDVTVKSSAAIATISKGITVDLDGKHLQIIQNASGAQIIVNTTSAVTFKNGRISCAASYEYGQRTKDYDIADPLFVASTVAADIRLDGVSTFTGGIFYNKVSGSKLTVDGGYHNQITLTKSQDRGIVIAEAGITSCFKNASIYIEYTGALLVGKSTQNMSFTYDNCVVVLKDAAHRFIRVANDKTFVYFNNSVVYGAFAQPTNSVGGQFTSANLIFNEGTTWGYSSVENYTVVTPSVPTGCAIEAITATTVSYNKYAISGTFYNNDFVFPESTTVANTTVSYSVVNHNVYEVTSGSTVTYYDESTALPDVIAAAPAGATIKLLKNVTYNTTANIVINKALTFDLNGYLLALGHSAKEQTFRIQTASTVKFMNGSIATIPTGSYASSGSTFAFFYVWANNANIVLDNVNGTVSSLSYSYGYIYTITVNGGTYRIDNAFTDMNTSGFVAGQNNFTANINNATIYVNKGYLVGASSYKRVADLMNSKSTSSVTYDGIKSQISTKVTFTGCNIIAPSFANSVIGTVNEFTKIAFNGCYLYGSVDPSKNGSDTIKCAIVGGKYYTSVSVCSCATFTDAGGDSKCDTCSKYDPAVVSTIIIGDCPASNIVIGEGTYYSTAALLDRTTVGNALVVFNVSETKDFDGTTFMFDRKTDYLRVTWYDENGNVLKTEKIDGSFNTLVGRAPAYEGVGGVTNGWYKIGGYVANGWTNVSGGTNAVDFASYDLTNLTESLNFYPQVSEGKISAYLSAAMYNLSIAGSIRNNFYIPDTPANVEILGVFVGDREIEGTRVLFRDYDNEPVYYTMYAINAVGATEFTKITEFVVKYRVNGNIELEQPYNISAEKYANIIYKDSQKTSGNVYNTQSYNVTADLVRYSYLLSVYAKVEDTDLTALYNKMKGLCSALPSDNDLAGSTANTSAFAGMGSIAFEASAYNPRWKFTLNSSAKITDIKITLDGYRNGVYADRTNFTTHTYGISNVVKDANGYITTAYSSYMPVYNIGELYTITFTKADGTEVSATYDMKAYYSAVAKDTAVADFLKSVVALSKSTIAYKFPEGKITINDVAEFWDCDHAPAKPITPIVSGNYNFKPRYCSKCDSYLFYYEDYGAVADGKSTQSRTAGVSGTNDYEAIYWTHMNANQWAQKSAYNGGKHTAVIGNSNPSVQKKYYISVPEGRGVYKIDANNDGIVETEYKNGSSLGTITVATDTSWNGVYFIIDDNAVCLNDDSMGCTCGRAHHGYTGLSIFAVDEYGTEKYTVNLLGKMASTLKPGDTNIGYAPGRKMLINIESTAKKIWYRYGSNASNGVASNEIILVDEFGNIDPTTPVQWDYPTITKADGYAVDTAPITISGLDNNGNINSYYENFVNHSTEQSIPHYEQLARNIKILRSNATVEGIYHYFTEDAYSSGSNKRTAYAFVNVQFCSNATVKDMSVVNHNGYPGDSGVSQGSYEFSGADANATSWINCVTRNLFSSTQGALQAYPVYRGLFGTNRMRNMYLKDCYLNSFDAHTGAHNVTIEDSTFEHMNFVGGGQITLKNIVIYTTKNYGSVVNLREDYGSIWKGDLYIDGLEVRYTTASDYKPDRITLIRGSYTNYYYGFDDGIYMPQNAVINNFHTRSYTASVSNGVRTESLSSSVDASTMKVYYYYAIDSLKESDAATTTAPGTNLPTAQATSGNGTSVLNCTKNLTITNSVSFTLPEGTFWKNMNVTMNGSKYTATEKKKFDWSSFGYIYYLSWSK